MGENSLARGTRRPQAALWNPPANDACKALALMLGQESLDTHAHSLLEPGLRHAPPIRALFLTLRFGQLTAQGQQNAGTTSGCWAWITE